MKDFLVPFKGIILLSLVVALVVGHDIPDILGSSIGDLVNADQDMASFLSHFQDEESDESYSNLRALGEDHQHFGERCGNRNACEQGFDCEQFASGKHKRCLPNTCLQEHTERIMEAFDFDLFKQSLLNDAQFTEEEIFGKLEEVGDARKFVETEEFQALQAALRSNVEPLDAVENATSDCIDPYQDDQGSVSYLGLHLEAGALVDVAMQFMVARNGDNSRDILRLCAGAELGGGAEISFLFGFANTPDPANMACGSATFEVDAVIIAAMGATIGIQFNNVFFYEFTIGGGIGAGAGGAWCWGIATNTTATTAPLAL